jgi:hypothetical protein
MERLFAMRQAAYARAHHQIEASGPAEEIAERILDVLHLN